jgi:hypothetical protein
LHNLASKRLRRESAGAPRSVKVAAMLLLPVLVAAIVACDSGSGSNGPTAVATNPPVAAAPYANSPEGKPPGLNAPVPDPKEVIETKPAGQLPDFISQLQGKALTKTTALYQGALDNYDAYSHVPCYCGCAIYTTAHKSLGECFIKQKTADGQVAFTDHSLTCDLCQTAAQMTLDGLAQHTPLADVRAGIFKKLSYTGIWTDTPPAP